MKYRKITIQNALEWQRIKGILDDNEIPYQLNRAENSAFPATEINNQPYEFIIPNEFTTVFFNLVGNELPSQLIEEQPPQKRTNLTKWLLLLGVYALVISILWLRTYRTNQRLQADKHYTSEWNSDFSEVLLHHNTKKLLLQKHHDKNFDLNYEKMEVFWAGKLISESIDADEDGVFEVTKYLDSDGQVSSKYTDNNNNMMSEKIEFFLENGERIILLDDDQNNIYQLR